MRISDWSSDVCSADLAYWRHEQKHPAADHRMDRPPGEHRAAPRSAAQAVDRRWLGGARCTRGGLARRARLPGRARARQRIAALSALAVAVQNILLGRATFRAKECQVVLISVVPV